MQISPVQKQQHAFADEVIGASLFEGAALRRGPVRAQDLAIDGAAGLGAQVSANPGAARLSSSLPSALQLGRTREAAWQPPRSAVQSNNSLFGSRATSSASSLPAGAGTPSPSGRTSQVPGVLGSALTATCARRTHNGLGDRVARNGGNRRRGRGHRHRARRLLRIRELGDVYARLQCFAHDRRSLHVDRRLVGEVIVRR